MAKTEDRVVRLSDTDCRGANQGRPEAWELILMSFRIPNSSQGVGENLHVSDLDVPSRRHAQVIQNNYWAFHRESPVHEVHPVSRKMELLLAAFASTLFAPSQGLQNSQMHPARRRSNRISKAISIMLSGSDIEGKQFSEQTKTLVLSRHGAGIVSVNKLAPQAVLIIRCVETNKEAAVRVVGQVARTPESYTYGVAFVEPSVDLWDVKFAPEIEAEAEAKNMLLECTSCHNREAIHPNDIELDVYAINQAISRYCKDCGQSTPWREVDSDADTKPPSIDMQKQPEVLPIQTPRRENRRKDVRAKVKFSACIRYSGAQEIVACENVSRGGFCFRSPKRYVEKSMIEVALPYSPGEAGIFVPARIVYAQELATEKLFRCGAAYVKS